MKAFWVDDLLLFREGVAHVYAGDEEAMEGVETGVRVIVGFVQRWAGDDARFSLMDDAREGREDTSFSPKSEGLLEVGGGL